MRHVIELASVFALSHESDSFFCIELLEESRERNASLWRDFGHLAKFILAFGFLYLCQVAHTMVPYRLVKSRVLWEVLVGQVSVASNALVVCH